MSCVIKSCVLYLLYCLMMSPLSGASSLLTDQMLPHFTTTEDKTTSNLKKLTLHQTTHKSYVVIVGNWGLSIYFALYCIDMWVFQPTPSYSSLTSKSHLPQLWLRILKLNKCLSIFSLSSPGSWSSSIFQSVLQYS